MVIYKKQLNLVPVQTIEIPAGAEILHAHEQSQAICIWFRCDASLPPENRTIAIIPTGSACPEADGHYIGTVHLAGGDLILHIFEKAEGDQA